MPRFCANLTLMFTEWPLLDRVSAAADAGFRAVEILFPYEVPARTLASRLAAHKMTLALINFPPGDFTMGERGLACLPDRQDDFAASLAQGFAYAAEAGVTTLHLMGGLGDRHDPATLVRYSDSIRRAADKAAETGALITLEPLNGRDVPGYVLDDFGFAARLIAGLGHPAVKLQFDVYHRQILHGDVLTGLVQLMPMIGHIQTAGVPDRHEPMSGELDDTRLFAAIDQLGYNGLVGAEYRPKAGTTEGLAWFAPYRDQQDAS